MFCIQFPWLVVLQLCFDSIRTVSDSLFLRLEAIFGSFCLVPKRFTVGGTAYYLFLNRYVAAFAECCCWFHFGCLLFGFNLSLCT